MSDSEQSDHSEVEEEVPVKDAKVTKKRKTKGDGEPKLKKPPTSFILFMKDFRVQYMKDHPDNKSVTEVGKAAGVEWGSLSQAEKDVYNNKSKKLKEDFLREHPEEANKKSVRKPKKVSKKD